ncbi:MAG: hypothetical protein ABW061_06555 [Polyangiaceae bacterium]
MRDLRMGRFAPVAAVLAACALSQPAAAQTSATPSAPANAAPAPTQPPPAGYAYPPPPGYGYQYPPPPGYAYPAYSYQQRRPPESVPYQGGPIPTGYHLEERPRKGLIISGALLTGIPWAIGLSAVAGSNFPNSSGWLVVPALGPWLTLAARHDSRCSGSNNDVCIDESLNSAARTILVLDGLMQTAGAVLFIVGVSSNNQVLARNFTGHLRLTPATIGRQGAGALLSGDF